jgi:hypothetical protein
VGPKLNDIVPVELVRKDLLQAITEYRVSPSEIAREAGLSPKTVAKIARGQQPRVTRKTVGVILEAILRFQYGEVPVLKPRPAGAEPYRAHQGTWTHCAHGHEFNEANLYIKTNGKRACRICLARIRRDYRRRASGKTTQ